MDLDFEINCPDCGATVKVTIQDVAKQRSLRCRRGHRFTPKDDGGGARKTQRSMDDLDRVIKRLGN